MINAKQVAKRILDAKPEKQKAHDEKESRLIKFAAIRLDTEIQVAIETAIKSAEEIEPTEVTVSTSCAHPQAVTEVMERYTKHGFDVFAMLDSTAGPTITVSWQEEMPDNDD